MSVEIVGYTDTTVRLPSIGQTATITSAWTGALLGVAIGFMLTRKSVKSRPSLLLMAGLGLVGYIIAKDMQSQ